MNVDFKILSADYRTVGVKKIPLDDGKSGLIRQGFADLFACYTY